MNMLSELRSRFAAALTGLVDDPTEFLDLIRRSQDPKFGDYQVNCAMPLGKQLKRPPREVAAELVEKLDVSDLCEPPEIAGPGFINLRIKDGFLVQQLATAAADVERLGVEPAAVQRTYVVDYSAPNVAKPMHVGHIRSTVIGDALYRTLSFLGHRVIGDNHIGDWGTQFGMIIYGYKHFYDASAGSPSVGDLSRLYRRVNTLVDYHASRQKLPQADAAVGAAEAALADAEANQPEKPTKSDKKKLSALRKSLQERKEAVETLQQKIARVDAVAELRELAAAHPEIGKAVLEETVKLHHGDEENLRLWREFVPRCLEDIERIYRRLGVSFDETLGESFYQDHLAAVVDSLSNKGIAAPGEGGAICVFDDRWPNPMLIRKQDGAFLYATTDLATIQYRAETWQPHGILYVVDHRQSLHFQQLFDTARRWGYDEIEFQHVAFGTVMGEDGKPFKTRSGETVGLESLLDEAVARALQVVSEKDEAKPDGPELSEEDRQRISEVVGIGGLKYADLSQNRTSDYVFSFEKMLALNGNTATYMQYAYARVMSIFRRGGVDPAALRQQAPAIRLGEPAERAVAIELLRFEEVLDSVIVDYRPNLLTAYLFDLANRFATFFEACPVLKADSEEQRASRLQLCDLTARTMKKGLALLGIGVVEKM